MSHTSPPVPPRRRSAACVAVAALLTVAVVLPRAVAAAQAPGAESPQALVARLNAAAAKSDFAELAACIAPDERAEMALVMTVMGGVVIAFMGMGGEMATGMAEGLSEGLTGQEMTAEQKAEMEKGKAELGKKSAEMQQRFEAILKKYGLQDKLEGAEASGLMADGGPAPGKARELLKGVDDVALLRDMMALFKELGDETGKESEPLHVPKDVRDYRIEGASAFAKSGDETVAFVKVDGRWYLKPETHPAAAPASDDE